MELKNAMTELDNSTQNFNSRLLTGRIKSQQAQVQVIWNYLEFKKREWKKSEESLGNLL